MFAKNSCYEMICEGLGQDAAGVCRYDGIAVFVPDLLPGERAIVRIVKPEKRYAYGRVEKRLSDSPDRQTPFCPIARRCGGCTCQHMAYSATLSYKQNQVKELIARIAGLDIDVPPVIGMEEPYHYRNKGMYPVGTENGLPVCGFFAQRTHSLVPLPPEGCAIQGDDSAKAVQTVLSWARELHVPIYDERTGQGLLRHVMTRNASDGRLMVVLVVTRPTVPGQELLTARLSALPSFVSLCLSVNANPGNTILGHDIRVLFGPGEMTDTLFGLQFQISPLSFFQVNPQQTLKLYGKALEFAALDGTQTVIDAYCGTGTISLLMARQAQRVIGIEIVEAAVQNARENALRNQISNAEFMVGATEAVLPDLIHSGLKPDVIVLDPPRKGCDEAVLDAIISSAPSRIVYVSCGAPTLARDLKLLASGGYFPQKIQCVDMFCWTSSVETVVCLSNKNSKPRE